MFGKGLDSFQGLTWCQHVSHDLWAPLGFHFSSELNVFPSGLLDSHHKVVWLIYNPGFKAIDLSLTQSNKWIWS